MRPAACWKAISRLGLLAAVPVLGQAGDPPPLDLPPMAVSTAAPPPKQESWRYASFGNFEILSKPADLSARGLLAGLQEFDYALRLIFPATAARSSGGPLVVVLAHDADYRSFVAGTAPAGEEFSRYVHGNERSAIVVNMDATDPQVTSDLYRSSTVDPSRQLNRQYLRHVFGDKGVRLPNWLEEGLAQIIADIEFRDAWLTYGKVVTAQNMPDGEMTEPINAVYDFLAPNPALSGLSFKEAFARRAFMPLGEFFAARQADGSPPSSDSAWAKQAYAFVHYCLFGNQLRYRPALMTFVEHLGTAPPSDELFTRCFGVNYATMKKELWGYLLHTRHQYQRYELKPNERLKPEPVEFREAADDEIALLKGAALQLCGNDAIAEETYRQAYLRGVRTPDFLVDYAQVCFRRGDGVRARALLEAALAKGARRPSAYVLQARLRLDHSGSGPNAAGKLDDTRLAAVLTSLFTARQLKPAVPEVYTLIAEAWTRSETPPKPENLAVLGEGIRLFPREWPILIQSIEAYRRLGDRDKIISIAQLGLRMGADAQARAVFEPLVAPVATEPKH